MALFQTPKAQSIDRWLAISVNQGNIKAEEVNDFINRVGLDRDIPSKTGERARTISQFCPQCS